MADNQRWVYRSGNRRVTGLNRKNLRRLLSFGILDANTLIGEEDQHYLQPLGKSPAAVEMVNAIEDLARRFMVLPLAVYLLIFPVILGGTVLILEWLGVSGEHWGFWTALTLGKLGICCRLFRIWRFHLKMAPWSRAAWRSFPFVFPMLSMIWCWISLYPLVEYYSGDRTFHRFSNRWMKSLCWAVIILSYFIGLVNFIPGTIISRQWWLLLFTLFLGAFSLLMTSIERRQAIESRHSLIKLARGALHTQAAIDYQAILTAENKLIRRGRISTGWFLGVLFIIGWLTGGWALFKTMDNNHWVRVVDGWDVKNRARSFLDRGGHEDFSTFAQAVERFVDEEDLPEVMLQPCTVITGASDQCREQLEWMTQRTQPLCKIINYALERNFLPRTYTLFFQGVTEVLSYQINTKLLQNDFRDIHKKWVHLQWLHDLTLCNYEIAVSNYSIYHGILLMDIMGRILNNSELSREELVLWLNYSLQHEIILRQTALAGLYNYLDLKKRDFFHYFITPEAEEIFKYLMHDWYEMFEDSRHPEVDMRFDWQDISESQARMRFLLRYNLAVLSNRGRSTMLALRLYALDHNGSLPDDLNALVPEYLPTLPIDPLSGRVLEYTRGMLDTKCAYWQTLDHADIVLCPRYGAELRSRHPIWLYIKQQFKVSWKSGVVVLARPVVRDQSTLTRTNAVRQGK